jgi:Phosphotransferase enzyme family
MTQSRHDASATAAPEVDALAVGEAVRDLAAADLGGRPACADDTAPIWAGWGPDAYRVRLATDDPRWTGTLVARTSAPDALARERAWVTAARDAGFPAPEPVTDGDAQTLLVFRQPAGTNLAERMISDMPALPRLLGDFGRLHARLHQLEPPDSGAARDAPAAPALDGDAAPAVVRQREWLDAHRPEPTDPVVCHGEFNPAHVLRDGDEGPGVPVNWTASTRAEPEFDVAATLVGFWSTALYGNAVQRRALKMVREPLATTYLSRYREAASRPLDDDRLRYWKAHHLHRLAAAIDHRLRRGATGPWDTSAHVAIPTRSLRDVDREFRLAAGG